MRKWTIFLILLTLFFCAIQPVLAADPYASLKTQYINDHPAQSLIPYPWDPSSSQKVLPFDYIIPAAPDNTISLTASRDQFESATFVINARKDLTGITIAVPALTDGKGNSIPASAVNVRTVKVWYQACAADVYCPTRGYFLTPELLLKDDSLVKVDYANKINYLKVTINGIQQYIDISNPANTVPSNAQIQDAISLQPFSLKADENKQIWVTVHVPAGTPAGEYAGALSLAAPSETPVLMNFTVTVLPFDLEPSQLDYGINYRGRLASSASQTLPPNFEYKTTAQYSAELQDMKEHGIAYPTMSQGYLGTSDTNCAIELSLRDQTGLPTDHIYVLGLQTGNSADTDDLAMLQKQVDNWQRITSPYGYSDVYIYGMDEASDAVLLSEKPAWTAVHATGAKVFVATSDNKNAVTLVGNLLDVVVFAGPLNTTQAAQWHSYGHKIYSYANPQVGVENPSVYRTNYGFVLWNAGYDGAMDYAYQHGYGNIWNDYDKGTEPQYRDFAFAYPTSNGVIDTIQWEGWREGVDDTRYLATLIKNDGNDIAARSIVSSSLSAGNDMATIRKKLIDRLLSSDPIVPAVPVAAFSGTPVSGTAPLKVTFTDTSTNTPTSWSWSFGDGSQVNATVRNPIHTYAAAGNYTVSLTVTNAAGKSSTTKTNYINVTAIGNRPPVLSAIPVQNVLAGTEMSFTVSATDADGDTLTYSAANLPANAVFNPTYRIFRWTPSNTQAGVNTVSFSVTDGKSSDTETAQIIVNKLNRASSKLGVYNNGAWYIDFNGNMAWDSTDASMIKSFGLSGDKYPVVGDWTGDGKDEMGVFRGGVWYPDYNGNGNWDTTDASHLQNFGLSGDQYPVVGDWTGDGKDKVGVFRGGVWYPDYNGNGNWDTSDASHLQYFGLSSDKYPVVGDWNNDGKDEVGVFRGGVWYLDYNGNGNWDTTDASHLQYFGLSSDKYPVVGDWNNDGKDEVGVFRGGVWYLDYNGNGNWDSTDASMIKSLGLPSDTKPVVGKWS
jgi:PKD repeat protein